MKQYKDRKKGKDKKQEKIELLLLFILENFIGNCETRNACS